MDQVYLDSLALHEKHQGKLELKSKVPVNNKHDLSLDYNPGLGQVCVEIGKDKSLARK